MHYGLKTLNSLRHLSSNDNSVTFDLFIFWLIHSCVHYILNSLYSFRRIWKIRITLKQLFFAYKKNPYRGFDSL